MGADLALKAGAAGLTCDLFSLNMDLTNDVF